MSDFEINEVLIPKTGRLKNIYKYKNRKCYRIPLKSIMSEQLAGWTLIEKDLRNASIWLEEIREMAPANDRKTHGSYKSGDRKTFNVIKALFVAALTLYAKAFLQSDGRRAKLTPKNLDEEFRENHSGVLAFRHNFAAHSGEEKHENVSVCLVLDSSKKRTTPPQIFCELVQPDTFCHNEMEEFIALVEHARAKVLEKIQKTRQRILQEEILPKGQEYWQKVGKKNA